MKSLLQLRRWHLAVACVILGGVFVPPAQSDSLPDDYAYELVAPANSYGQRVYSETISPDGNGVVLGSVGALEDVGNAPDLGGVFFAQRASAGWATVPLTLPATLFPTWSTDSAGAIDLSGDGRSALLWVQLQENKNTRKFTPVKSSADGTYAIAGPTVDDSGPGLGSVPIAASADLRTVVIRSVRRNLTTDGAPDTRAASRNGLYVSRPSPDSPEAHRVRQVAFRAGAAMNPSTCSVQLGSARTARSAVSDDGRRIFFSFEGLASCTTAANQRVWVRDGDAEAEDLSAGFCVTNCGAQAPAFFEGASQDAQRVYFTTEQKLLDSDLDDTDRGDLYVHDSAFAGSNRLRAVTASGGVGQGAGVVGVVRVSDDGSHVYFVAKGRSLAGPNAAGDSPQPGEANLYVYRRPRTPLSATPTIDFIGTLASADIDRGTQFSLLNAQNRPVVTSTDGRFLLFVTRTDLTGDKLPGDSHRDLYRYDSQTGALLRIWSAAPEHNGAARTDGIWPATIGPKETSFNGARQRERRGAWMISDDGKTIAFSTSERLSSDDVNDKRDAYMWNESTGATTMLSGGRSIRDLDVAGVSRGGDVFFVSDAQLVPEHRSGTITTFVARKGGGFAPPPSPLAPCAGDSCQGPLGTGPSLAGSAPTSQLVGPGNEVRPTLKLTATGPAKARGSRATLRVRATLSGRLTAKGSRLVTGSRLISADRQALVPVRLSAAGRRSLARGRAVRVPIQLRFRSTSGEVASKRVVVTFRPDSKRGTKAGMAAHRGQR